MSIESIAIAMHHSRAQGTARLVLYGIANHDGDGGSWPSVATLQKYTGGVTRANVQKAITRLEQLGEVRRIVSAGGDHSMADHRRPNLYKFLLVCPHDCDHTSNHRTGRSVDVMLSDELSTGASVARRGIADEAGGGLGSEAQTIHLNQINKEPRPTTVAREQIVIPAPTCTQGHQLEIEGRYCLYGCPTKTFLEEIQEQHS